uniref:Uncharacterized protein n=1 Tax=Branchiostoma floridae TaxID=7739 RepID=C3YFJ8_BRAFL|eukprot:XP_002604951.1 hypothetical protein BRAFLDRAFT_92591 [Branchiostoma floridae]
MNVNLIPTELIQGGIFLRPTAVSLPGEVLLQGILVELVAQDTSHTLFLEKHLHNTECNLEGCESTTYDISDNVSDESGWNLFDFALPGQFCWNVCVDDWCCPFPVVIISW